MITILKLDNNNRNYKNSCTYDGNNNGKIIMKIGYGNDRS